MLMGLRKKSEMLDQKAQSITRDKENHLITLRGLFLQEDRCFQISNFVEIQFF